MNPSIDISNNEILPSNTESVPELESVPKENPVLETRNPDSPALPKLIGSNFSGIILEFQPKKKPMTMFWDGRMVQRDNIPDSVFTKESYYNF